MIQLTTFEGTKNVLFQYGEKYCIIQSIETSGHQLVAILDVESCMDRNENPPYFPRCTCDECCSAFGDDDGGSIFYFPEIIAHIPNDIMARLIDEGIVVKNMSDKEWVVQKALGTATYRAYLIVLEDAK